MERIILDTDFETDCDDVAALCVLHALERRGDVRILGVIASVHSPWPAGAVRAINLTLERPDIPVGRNYDYPNSQRYRTLRDRMETEGRLYHKHIAAGVPQSNPSNFQPEEGVALYRRLLENAEDSSVTICSIGFLTLLAELLRSPGGKELIRKKVKRMVAMADGSWPEGRPGFNWEMEPEAAEFAIREWPVELFVSPVGTNVLTGAKMASTAAPANPERIAFETFGSHVPHFRRPSWDQLTVLTSAGVAPREGYTGKAGRGKIVFDAKTLSHRWSADENGIHFCIGLLRTPEETAEWVEAFMIEPWK